MFPFPRLPRAPLLAALLASVSLAAATPGDAQVTRIVVGGPAGGNTDVAARLVVEKLAQALGGSVIVDNKPGAGGTLAAETVRNAKPDGTTIGLVTASNAANETLQAKKSFSLTTDLEPVGLYAWLTNVLIVHPSIDARNTGDLIAVLKSRPVTNYSSGGIGSPGHLSGETFKRRTGVQMTHIPYKGAPPAVLAVVSNEVTLMFATASAALPQIKGSTVRPIAVTSTTRLVALPDVPTFAESGLSGFDVRDWVGFVVPPERRATCANVCTARSQRPSQTRTFAASSRRIRCSPQRRRWDRTSSGRSSLRTSRSGKR